MGVFKSLGGALVRPYTKVFSDVSKSAKNIKSSLADAQAILNRNNENVQYTDSIDPRSDFEILVEKNNWTPEALKKQLQAVTRIKWTSLVLLWIFICSTIAVAYLASGSYSTLFGCGLCAISSFLFAIRVLQFSIFQTQLKERDLISYSRFMGRKDFWQLIFS